MLERDFQAFLIKELKKRYPNSIVVKNDPTYIQGIPDLTILVGDKWAALEIKKNEKAHKQPNQEYYIFKMNNMSYAAFVSPENKDQILSELDSFFKEENPK